MRANEVVEIEVATDAGSGFVEVVVGVQENLLVLDGAPHPLDEDVVEAPATSVHADRDPRAAQHLGERVRGELRALVAIENVGLREARQRLLERVHAEGGVERVGQSPTRRLYQSMMATR